MNPKTLLIVYHSMTGGTAQMAQGAAEGAGDEAGVLVRLLRAPDRCYYAALDRLNGRPYAALVCAGSDGQNAARQLERIATGWRLRSVAPTLIVCTHAQTPEAIMRPKQIGAAELAQCRDIGAALAAGLALGVY